MKIFNIKNERKYICIELIGIKLRILKFWKLYKGKNFELNSGERQTAKNLKNIRVDHTNRYEIILKEIKKYFKTDALNIADIFCGVGYGSYLLSKKLPNSKFVSVDGSKDAIKLAKKYYKTKNIKYYQKFFPFNLPKEQFDAICSMESIEHIVEDGPFLNTLINSLKANGLLFLSTPNALEYIREVNNDGWHIRHYTTAGILKLFDVHHLKLINSYGQNCYVFDENGVIKGYLPEEEMLCQENVQGQFQIYILKKLGGGG